MELRRRQAKTSLPQFIDHLETGFELAAHHRLLTEALEKVERGEIRRLMVNMPPGSAKSTYASVLFPPWFMGRNPHMSVLGVSNTTDLAERFSRRVRNIVGGAQYRDIFGFSLKADNTSAGSWETEMGGEYFAAGVGATITGRRADLGLIDDPIRTREEADSDRIREKQWDWYVNDFRTRLKPNARQIVIQTRWHEDDLSGRLLEYEGDQWAVIKLPMIAMNDDPLGRKPGEQLWPEWFTAEMVKDAKRDVRAWNALYQQEPAPLDGDYFQRDWFIHYESLPQNLHIYAASDYAVTEGGGDYTEHGIFGLDYDGTIYVIDWWRGQTTSDVWIEHMCNLILEHKPLIWFGEAGPIRRAIEPFLRRRMEERNTPCRLEWLPSLADKEVRARAIQARAAMGKVWLPKQAPWLSDVFGQLLKFPSGKHDDAVDVFSLIGRGFEMVKPPKMQKPKPAPNMQDQFSSSAWMG